MLCSRSPQVLTVPCARLAPCQKWTEGSETGLIVVSSFYNTNCSVKVAENATFWQVCCSMPPINLEAVLLQESQPWRSWRTVRSNRQAIIHVYGIHQPWEAPRELSKKPLRFPDRHRGTTQNPHITHTNHRDSFRCLIHRLAQDRT